MRSSLPSSSTACARFPAGGSERGENLVGHWETPMCSLKLVYTTRSMDVRRMYVPMYGVRIQYHYQSRVGVLRTLSLVAIRIGLTCTYVRRTYRHTPYTSVCMYTVHTNGVHILRRAYHVAGPHPRCSTGLGRLELMPVHRGVSWWGYQPSLNATGRPRGKCQAVCEAEGTRVGNVLLRMCSVYTLHNPKAKQFAGPGMIQETMLCAERSPRYGYLLGSHLRHPIYGVRARGMICKNHLAFRMPTVPYVCICITLLDRGRIFGRRTRGVCPTVGCHNTRSYGVRSSPYPSLESTACDSAQALSTRVHYVAQRRATQSSSRAPRIRRQHGAFEAEFG